MKRSSAQYRDWSLEEWCAHVRSLGVTRLTDWALVSRSSYNYAVVLGHQREIARRLGWLPKLDAGEMETMRDEEFVERFKQKGVRSMTDMWRSAQYWCEYLRQQGRLERIAEKLGFGYVVEWHPSDDIDYYLERCHRIGDFTAWCQLDKNAADAARKHGLLVKIRQLAPKRPAKGYPTAGGYCKSLPELAVARLLEANQCEFVTQMDYPFTFPRGKRHRSKCDFYLLTHGAFVEVWSVPATDTSAYWEPYQVRRRFKTAICQRLNLRLLNIEGQLLFRQGPDIFLRHVEVVLSQNSIKLPTQLTRFEALNPQYSTDVSDDG